MTPVDVRPCSVPCDPALPPPLDPQPHPAAPCTDPGHTATVLSLYFRSPLNVLPVPNKPIPIGRNNYYSKFLSCGTFLCFTLGPIDSGWRNKCFSKLYVYYRLYGFNPQHSLVFCFHSILTTETCWFFSVNANGTTTSHIPINYWMQ